MNLNNNLNKAGFASHLILILLLAVVVGITVFIATQKTSWFNNAQAGDANDSQTINSKVLVVIYDPLMPNHGNVKLSEYYHWGNPKTMSDQLVSDFKTISHDQVTYKIVETVEQNNWLPHMGGLRYTENDYINVYAAKNWNKGNADWTTFLAENDIISKINSGAVDEVWLWAPPEGGYPESIMFGNGSYWMNSGPFTTNTKAFPLMDFNYERGMAEAIHSYGHRVESIISRVYGRWNQSGNYDGFNPWEKFSTYNKQVAGKAGCGNVHWSPNSAADYDYSNNSSVTSNCDDWLNYPNMTGATTTINCSAWNCDAYSYQKWWFSHIPHSSGFTDGYFNNWWRYIIDIDTYKNNPKFNGQFNLTPINPDINKFSCTADGGATCSATIDTTKVYKDSKSIKFTTNGAFDTKLIYPTSADLNFDTTDKPYLSMNIYAVNSNFSFQNSSPVIFLKTTPNDYIKLTPQGEYLNDAVNNWKNFQVPLAGNGSWAKTTTGNPTSIINQIEIHSDTWGDGFTLYYDSLGFGKIDNTASTNPQVSITSPSNGTVAPEQLMVKANASDQFGLTGVELQVDGQYIQTDNISPYVFTVDQSKFPYSLHTLKLKAQNVFGQTSDSSEISFTGGNKPAQVSFDLTPNAGRSPLSVQFSSNIVDEDVSSIKYNWDFGDGGISTDASPSHIFQPKNDSGNNVYTVTLSVTDSQNQKSQATQNVNVTANTSPQSKFSATPTSGKSPLTINFTNTSSDPDNDVLTYLWNFGDGQTSSDTSPSHEFTVALDQGTKTFPVTLTATDNGGAATNSTVTISIDSQHTPVANFSLDQTTGRSPLKVSLTNNSTDQDQNDTLSYLWDFGDGQQSSSKDPVHTFTRVDDSGTDSNTITLTTTDSTGNTSTIQKSVTVSANNSPVSNFVSQAPTGTAPAPVVFTNSSSDPDNDVLTYLWNFGDGQTSTLVNPTHQYNPPLNSGAKTYTVTLKVTDLLGANGLSSQTVTVNSQHAPISDFTLSPASGRSPLKVTFTNKSSDPDNDLSTYKWDFGDGQTSTAQNPQNTFTVPVNSSPITRVVTLLVTDSQNNQSSSQNEVTISANHTPTSSFVPKVVSGTSPLKVLFTNTSSDADNDPLTYAWTFGDGQSSVGKNPAVTYKLPFDSTPRIFNVVLTVTDSFGEKAVSAPVKISVTPNYSPIANFSYTLSSSHEPSTATFKNLSTDKNEDNMTYLWKFGDGPTTSTLQDPTHLYIFTDKVKPNSKTFVVSLTATDLQGAKTTKTQQFTLPRNYPPVANFTIGTQTINGSQVLIPLTNASTDKNKDVLTYLWNFGDKTKGTDANPTHPYPAPAMGTRINYTIKLTVKDPSGESNSISKVVTLHNP